MPIDSLWLQFAINVAAGSVAGGVTNAIAVWMLFHPYERRFGIHGAIPKNKARLAHSIGRTVGERLLTPGDVATEITQSGLQATFAEKVTEVLAGLLDTERPALRELLPPAVLAEVERSLEQVAPTVAESVARYLDTPEFEERLRQFVARARAELAARPIGELLTHDRRQALSRRAEEWAGELAESPELERGVRDYLDRHATQLLASPEPLLEKVPAPVVQAIESAIDAYLPLAVARLGGFLAQPTARDRIREALHSIFGRFVDDLRFHERVIARLVVTERTFDKALESLERDGVEQVAALLEDPLMREEISRTIHEAVLTYLRKPVVEIVGGSEERARALVTVVGDYLLRVLRSERTRGFLIDKINGVLERSEDRTWGDLLAPLEDETVVGWLRDAARGPRTRELLTDGTRAALRGALARPIGRPGRWLPPDTAPRVASVVAPALWDWIQSQVPALVQRIDIEGMVERKVLGFSTQRIEEIIRSVTQKELELIVNLGYVLGAMIGVVTFGVSRLFQ